MLRKWLPKTEKGQSLVELVIVTPLLIFLMIGVFEVGWVLRGYLVLVNVNREITRYAIRPGYMNFSTYGNVEDSWKSIRTWVDTAVTGQLPLNFDGDPGDIDPNVGNATLIISHLVADTGFPCKDINDPACSNCAAFEDPNYNPFPQDDLIIDPSLSKFDYQTTRIGPDETVTGQRVTRQNYTEIIKKMVAQNNQFNCEILKRGGVPSANNVIITELFYDQPQLFGFPLISNPFTDPVPLYTHTTMRMIGAARSTGSSNGDLLKDIDAIGPICLAFPLLANGNNLSNGQTVDIAANGWLQWNQNTGTLTPAEYLDYSLQFPQMSVADFVDPTGSTVVLKTGSRVNIVFGSQDVRASLKNLVGQRIIIPYSNTPTANPVVVDGFVWATIGVETNILPPGNGAVTGVNAQLTLDTPESKYDDLPEACSP
ncbi:MAG: pilus assembly protein [Anaerolineaceae bacterium]|nr:pilus assembly protein [Anaerolineaceae bacterium]MCB9098323.1 pilus assembly protein [Anaerolineales bacterium]